MLGNIKISPFQLFVLVFLFEMGSAILFGIGAAAKQDAWITILLGMAGGIVLFLIYHRLFFYYPDLPLTGYVQKIVGKGIGRAIGFFYIIYFIYLAARVLRDFGELLTSTIYYQTPIFIINSLMIITILYGLYKGLEVMARLGELLFMLIYLMAIFGIIFVIFSGLVHFENLRPMLENGMMPVFKTTLLQTLTFPFGEMVAFTMILPNLNEQKKAKKICLSAMMLSGINITITTIINISALGVDLFTRSSFPLLSTIQKIQLLNFIERLDVLFLMYLVIGGFVKISIYYYAAIVGTVDVFNLKTQDKIIFPIALIILFASIEIASSFAEHTKEGLALVPVYLHWPFQIIIPSVLLVIAFFRNRNKQAWAGKNYYQ